MKAEQVTTEHSPNVGHGNNIMTDVGDAAPAMERLFERLRGLWREPAIDSTAALRVFLGQQAAFVAQKCAIEYCRGKAGIFASALFVEQSFNDALTICRWEALAAVVADTLILAEGALRPAAGPRAAAVGERLCDLYPVILMDHGVPAHRPDGWADVVAAFGPRLEAAQAEPPKPAADVATFGARRLFETLPIHPNMRRYDEEIVFGDVRFRMVAFRQQLERRLDKPAVVRDLLGDGAG